MTEADLQAIEKAINSEDRPEDVWWLEKTQALVDEVRRLQTIIDDEWNRCQDAGT